MRQKKAAIIGAFAMVCGVSVQTDADRRDIAHRDEAKGDRRVAAAVHERADRLNLSLPQTGSSVKIENVRLEPGPAAQTLPSVLLKFDMLNVSSHRVTDVVLEISIVEKTESDHVQSPPRVLVGPFSIHGTVVLEAGYTITYEMLLRNFSSDCGCVANVDVLSLRSLAGSGS